MKHWQTSVILPITVDGEDAIVASFNWHSRFPSFKVTVASFRIVTGMSIEGQNEVFVVVGHLKLFLNIYIMLNHEHY
jgi:hypothetical protein